jgi:hypothetical protein
LPLSQDTWRDPSEQAIAAPRKTHPSVTSLATVLLGQAKPAAQAVQLTALPSE